MKRLRVLIIDDSAVIRRAFTEILNQDPDIEVMGTAADPYIAASKIAEEVPDVITLDVEMPRMDGLTFLRKLMSQHPIPVVVISSLTAHATESAILAMEYGAVSVLKKPDTYISLQADIAHYIIDAVKSAGKAKLRRKSAADTREKAIRVKRPYSESMAQTTDKVIAVGASTGGTEAILEFLRAMPLDTYGIVIVQHMPEVFTRSFADRLNNICDITVKEAAHGDTVIRGRALIAPGNKHMELKRSGARYYVELNDHEPVNRHRPSVDVLFRSTAKYAGKNSIGIIMTGMGADGAAGLLEMKQAGAETVAQNEESCVVFGMPKEAIKLGAANKTLALERIADYVSRIK
ncbi:MAG TPA: chemotaxis response regulator protein-glutamate methylesterase [Ohtaekwangia sp.]|uniref:protein-glutamate methylesterase/protein-glutamine glutaminase n=1 Tax=Ohtaekwangia sp. TaxID=2066019 RepID=UPI002F92E6A1